MKRSFKSAVLSLCAPFVLVGALAACGDSGGATPEGSNAAAASGSGAAKKPTAADSAAKPADSVKTQQKAETPSGSSSVAAADPAKSAGAPTPPAPTGPASTSDVAKLMPATCDQGRIYVNFAKLSTPELKTAMEGMRQKFMDGVGAGLGAKGKVDTEKLKKLQQLEKDSMLGEAFKEVAVCVNGKEPTLAASFDASKLKGSLTDTIMKFVTEVSGTAPTKSEEGGVTYIEVGKGFIGISGSNVVAGKTKADVKTAIDGAGAGAAGFSGADANLIWAKFEGKTNLFLTVMDGGADFNIKVVTPPPIPELASAMKKDPAEVPKTVNAMIDKLAPNIDKVYAGASALLKKIKVSVDGQNLVAELALPKATIADFMTKTDLSKLGGM